MAWNPSTRVATARDFGVKFGKQQVIVISICHDEIEVVSYGKTKLLCDEAKRIADYLYEETFRYLTT